MNALLQVVAAALPAPIRAMLDELDGAAIAEVERALRGRLTPKTETPAERRARRLGFLARLIEETGSARVPRVVYDEARPDTAPSGQELVDEFRLWRRACRAAAGVMADGRINRPDGNNHHRTPGARTKTRAYSRDEIVNAVRRCALDTGRKPTANAYERWRAKKVEAAKRHGKPQPRLPDLSTIARTFPHWRQAIAAAAIDQGALARAREEALPRIERRPPTLTATELTGAGGGHLLTKSGAVDQRQLELLPLSEALALCRAIDCSLEYLLGAGDRGRSPSGELFAYETWKARLAESGVRERQLLQQIGMPLGPYRQLLRGKHQPTLAQLKTFAAIAAAPMSALLTEGETP
jgi:hypothetical protein